MNFFVRVVVSSSLVLLACGPEGGLVLREDGGFEYVEPVVDAGRAVSDAGAHVDAGARFDAGVRDAGPADAGPSANDAGLMDAGAFDAGLDDAGAMQPLDAGPPSLDAGRPRIPLFVAQGHLGRTMVSCDLGRTWLGNRDDDAGVLNRCWTAAPDGGTTIECDHQPNAGRGITFGHGYFMANFGWGMGGSVRRSVDGVTWETMQTGRNYAGTSYAQGRFMSVSVSSDYSDDDGRTWRASGTIANVWSLLGNVRRTASAAVDGGTLVVLSADHGLAVSRDLTATWQVLSNVPASCRAGQVGGGIAYGNGTLVLARDGRNGQSAVCSSTDQGATWRVATITQALTGQLLFDGHQFLVWGVHNPNGSGAAIVLRSTDGQVWTESPLTAHATGSTAAVTPPTLGVVGYGQGTFVAVNGEWDKWYGQQQLYRSTDGVSWERLPASAFVGSHPLRFMSFGMGVKPAVCGP